MNSPKIAILIFVLASGFTALIFSNKFKRSYPNDSKFGSVKLKYLFLCCLVGFLITGLAVSLFHL